MYREMIAVGFVILLLFSVFSVVIPAQAQANPIKNGDFSQGLQSWTPVKVNSGAYGGDYPRIGTHDHGTGNPWLYIDAPGGADGYVEQSIDIPSSGRVTLSFKTIGHRDPVTATISIIDSQGRDNLITQFEPACKIDVGCTDPETKTYDITPFSGQSVKLRFRVTSSGGTGTFGDFDDVNVFVGTDFDFTVMMSVYSATVRTGDTVTVNIAISLLRGVSQTVSLSVGGLSSTVGTITFSPPVGTPTFTATLQFGIFDKAPAGIYHLSVIASGGGVTRTASFTLTVQSFPQIADLAVTSLSVQPESPFERDTVTVQATISNLGSASALNIAEAVLVDGATLSVGSAYSLAPGQSITRQTNWRALAGTHIISWIVDPNNEISESTKDNNAKTIKVSTAVPPPVAALPPQFQMAVSPRLLSVNPGDIAIYKITVSELFGPPQSTALALSLSGLPPSVGTYSFVPSVDFVPFNSTLILAISRTAPQGTYQLMVTAESGYSYSVLITLRVLAPLATTFDFALSSNPQSHEVPAGKTVTYELTVDMISGQPQPISLSISGLPSTVGNYSLSLSETTSKSTLSVKTSRSALPGNYPLLLNGTANGRFHTVGLNLTILAETLSILPRINVGLITGTQGVIHVREQKLLVLQLYNAENEAKVYRVKISGEALDFLESDSQDVRLEPFSPTIVSFAYRSFDTGQRAIRITLFQGSSVIYSQQYLVDILREPQFWDNPPLWVILPIGAVTGYLVKEAIDISRKKLRRNRQQTQSATPVMTT